MTIAREQLRELAEFQDAKFCAVSFYFQPSTPRNKAHKEDTILIKDLAREALRTLESKGPEGKEKNGKEKKDCARADLDRILRLSGELRSNGTQGKAVFACAGQNLWREYDVPASLPGTQLFVDRHFHLKPLAHLLGAFPLLGIVLVDRHRARIFDLRLGELTEREDLFHPQPRRGRSDGFAGYDGGHAQRRVEDETRQHFKNVAEALKELLEKGVFEKWILACQDSHRSLLEPQLHSYVSQSLIGRFHADLAHATRDEIRTHAQQIVDRWQADRLRELVGQALSLARSNGRGVTGLRRVLRSLELGEVQTLLLGENLQAHAVECSGCGHIDAHLVSFCPVCGRVTREVVDVGEAILPWVIRRDIETFYVKDNPEFDKVGNIAALLRYRSENKQPLSTAVADQLGRAGAAYPGRLRRFASR
ncbi:MAG TPA: host attachment protein [Candidatus Sulfotelmatobacter sp.]|nr:host attachment protein [Candidatus Sulfotelmatobacter sp.]